MALGWEIIVSALPKVISQPALAEKEALEKVCFILSRKGEGGCMMKEANPHIYYDEWVTLGVYFFNGSHDGGEYVELTDATGEAGSTHRKIGFDAVRWER